MKQKKLTVLEKAAGKSFKKRYPKVQPQFKAPAVEDFKAGARWVLAELKRLENKEYHNSCDRVAIDHVREILKRRMKEKV